MFCFIFYVAILSGFGLSFLEKSVFVAGDNKDFWACKLLPILVVSVVLLDLWQVNSPIFKNPFKIPPIEIERDAFFRQKYDYIDFYGEDIYAGMMSHSSQYPVFLSNSGILQGYEIVNINRGDVRTINGLDYKGEVYLAKSRGSVFMEYFSP